MDLEIPKTYFREEEREGFLVSEEMKRCWAAEMKMLLQIGAVLDRHGLRWYADCGTLLGAVRHRGFVPWDDDVDIIMPRSDYQQAWQFLKNELPEYFIFQCSQLDSTYVEPWGSVINRSRSATNEAEKEAITAAYYGSPYQHAVDIYSLDRIPADPGEQEVLRTLYIKLYEVLYLFDSWEKWGLIEEVARMMEEVTGIPMPREASALRTALWNLNDALALMNEEDGVDALGADIMYFWANTGRTPRPIHAYEGTVMLPFEMIEIPVPSGYEEILKVSYGAQWMVPVRGGGEHTYPYFAIEKNELLAQMEAQT